jgi:hypothetical protein
MTIFKGFSVIARSDSDEAIPVLTVATQSRKSGEGNKKNNQKLFTES